MDEVWNAYVIATATAAAAITPSRGISADMAWAIRQAVGTPMLAFDDRSPLA